MSRTAVLALVTLVVVTLYVPTGAFAASHVSPSQGGCPTYLTALIVDQINSTPIQATVGDVVTTTFHVVYPDGTPVQLMPQTATFLWLGAAGSDRFDNVAVTFTGNPGFYNYTQTVTADLAQATLGSSSTGKITVYVALCSCSDAVGNRGPTGNIGSDETLSPSDNSHLNVGPQTPTQQPVNYIVPLAIALLIIAAILLFLRRSRSKKKK